MLGGRSRPGSRLTHRNCHERRWRGGLEGPPGETSLQPGRGAASPARGRPWDPRRQRCGRARDWAVNEPEPGARPGHSFLSRERLQVFLMRAHGAQRPRRLAGLPGVGADCRPSLLRGSKFADSLQREAVEGAPETGWRGRSWPSSPSSSAVLGGRCPLCPVLLFQGARLSSGVPDAGDAPARLSDPRGAGGRRSPWRACVGSGRLACTQSRVERVWVGPAFDRCWGHMDAVGPGAPP